MPFCSIAFYFPEKNIVDPIAECMRLVQISVHTVESSDAWSIYDSLISVQWSHLTLGLYMLV